MAKSRRPSGAVRKLPSGRYQARVRDPLTAQLVSIGTFPTKADADRAIALAVAAQTRSEWIDPKASKVRFGTYAEEWIAARDLRPTTRVLYEGLLRNHIAPTFGSAEVGRITPKTVRTWYEAMQAADNPGQTTRAKAYRLLRTILSTAVRDEIIVRNPCTLPGAGVEHTAERSALTLEEVYELADAITPRFRALVLLGAFCGLRLGELQNLRRRHVNLLQHRLTVDSQVSEVAGEFIEGPPKTKAGNRTVAIPERLLADLELHLSEFAAPGPDGLLFCSADGTYLYRTTLRRHWVAARDKVGLDGFTIHDLRHTGHTLAAGTGATVKELMRRLGHSSAQAALRYQHATEDRDQGIARALSALIDQHKPEPIADVVSLPERVQDRQETGS